MSATRAKRRLETDASFHRRRVDHYVRNYNIETLAQMLVDLEDSAECLPAIDREEVER